MGDPATAGAILGGISAVKALSQPPAPPVKLGRGIQTVQPENPLDKLLALGQLGSSAYGLSGGGGGGGGLKETPGVSQFEQPGMYDPTTDTAYGGYGGTISEPYGGKKQFGGPVLPGRQYTVGEAGPEQFVPSVPGNIIPNTSNGGINPYNTLTSLLGNPGNSLRPLFGQNNSRRLV